MTRRLVVVRPAPDNARTLAAARALGWRAEAMPLFALVPLAWTPPDPAAFDALVMTSANAARLGGAGLGALDRLPVCAVGEATARAARAAGLRVALTGAADAAALVAAAREGGHRRLLHLAGRDHVAAGAGVAVVAVYASEPLPPPADAAERLAGAVVLLHSARAARALAALPLERAAVAIAALSPATLAAAGTGWRAGVAAAAPTDAALLAAAATLGD